MTPTTNHELLDEYKASIEDGKYTQLEVLCILDKIQSQLIEPMEYEIGKDYEFSGCNQKSWYR